jgi:alpha-ketoglutarate-dependent taurine dioxygenase
MRLGNGCTVEIDSLSPAIGIKVRGLDLAHDLGDGDFDRLRRAWESRCVALFRDQSLSELDQVKFGSRFGPLGRAVNDLDPAKGGTHPAILYVSNVRVDGKPTGILPDGEMFFHSDTCYLERPAMASMLYAIEVPSRGGDTLFANGFAAYEALPDKIKTRLTGTRALNVYDYAANPTLRGRELAQDAKRAIHPIFRTHPATGRKSLYVNRLMTWQILGMAEEESREMLDFLFEHQEQPQFVYRHQWRPGDFVLWDNRSCLHARSDFDPAERRRLRRVTVLGDVPYEDIRAAVAAS